METITISQKKKAQISLPLEPIGWQWKVEKDTHKFKVVVAGARSGKTTFALNQLVIKAALKQNSINWYVAPTYGMAKSIAWEHLKWLVDDFRKWDMIHKINDSELLINFVNNSTIQLKGADNPDSLRGVGLDFLVLDEYATMKKEVWNEVLRPRIIDKSGCVVFIGTPKGYNHFYGLYQMELKEPKYWKSYHFKTIDNPYIPEEEIRQAEKDMDSRAFKQEFQASFEVFGGQVFTTFKRDKHATKEFDFDGLKEYEIGMDFGWSAPTATLFIQVDTNENVYVVDEEKATQTPIRDIATAIRKRGYKRIYEWPKSGATIEPDWIGCDPSGDSKSEAVGTSSVMELKKLGFNVKYKKNYPGIIQDGINQIRKWLQNDKLFIHPRCSNLIQAFEMYRYPDPKNDIQSEVPLKDGISDHWIDALRYFFLNRFPVKSATWRAL